MSLEDLRHAIASDVVAQLLELGSLIAVLALLLLRRILKGLLVDVRKVLEVTEGIQRSLPPKQGDPDDVSTPTDPRGFARKRTPPRA